MNHRIFERTLRPSVFRGACLFERHLHPQALLGVGRLSRLRARTRLKVIGSGLVGFSRSTFALLGAPADQRPASNFMT